MYYQFIKRITLSFLFFFMISHTKSQKAYKIPLDTSHFNQWPYVNSPAISNDGKYIGFLVSKGNNTSNTLHIRSTIKNREKTFANIETYLFSNNSKRIIILNKHDSLYILTLGTNNIHIISHVTSYRTILFQKKELLVYLRKRDKTDLVIQELNNEKEIVLTDITDYLAGNQASMLLLKRISENDETLSWMDLKSLKEYPICHHKQFESITIDDKNRQIAFIADKVLWRYKLGDESPLAIVTKKNLGTNNNAIIDNINKFNRVLANLFIIPSWSSRAIRFFSFLRASSTFIC